tara:strand:- start:9834 stop:10739 length:906 start_codon:yes stop_codon:yes gene_type:complete
MFSPSNILINGIEIKKELDKQISVFSPSFQYGLSVFEGIRGYLVDNKIKYLALDKHLKRLISSASLLGFQIDDNLYEVLNEDIKKLSDMSEKTEIYIKYILCYISEGNWSSTHKPDRVCFSYPLESNLKNKKDLISCSANFTSFRRINSNAFSPYIKCGANYINSRLGFLEVNYERDETTYPIFLNEQNYVCESSGSSIFIVKKNTVFTPPLSDDILPSINRDILIKLLEKNFIHIAQRHISRWELLDSDGILFVGTNIEMININKVGRHEIKTNHATIKTIFNIFKEGFKDDLQETKEIF